MGGGRKGGEFEHMEVNLFRVFINVYFHICVQVYIHMLSIYLCSMVRAFY